MSSHKPKPQSLLDGRIINAAALDAVRKLDPRALARNPVIFVTEAVSAVVTLLFLRDLFAANGQAAFSGQIAAWLWFTVLFANFAEAVAEGRGKAQADALRKTRTDTPARRYADPGKLDGPLVVVNAQDLKLERRRPRRARRNHPGRRRDSRGRRLGQQIGDHRRIRARSFARPAAIARRSPGARRCFPITSR